MPAGLNLRNLNCHRKEDAMKIIETERWVPSKEDPSRSEYIGQRTGQEVFEELRQQLENMGCLPDEYFLLDQQWEKGREIPKGADIFCTTDYGASEGIYLDVYLKWYEDGNPVTKGFITGKTLGESGDDLDNMFLISSAITKAFHGDGATHARYIRLGESQVPTSGVFHLSSEEQKTIIDALITQHEKYLGLIANTESLLRRMTGGITQYIDQMGRLPLQINDYDQITLTVRDGNLDAFKSLLTQVLEYSDDLLTQTAGRSGEVGSKMMILLMAACDHFGSESYLLASKLAVKTGDVERLRFLMDQAETYILEMEPGFVGRMIRDAYSLNPYIGREMMDYATNEQIAAAPAELMLAAVYNRDSRAAFTLARKGIDITGRASEVIRQYAQRGDTWELEQLIRDGMKIQPTNLSALKACIQADLLGAAKLLLEKALIMRSSCPGRRLSGMTSPLQQRRSCLSTGSSWISDEHRARIQEWEE